MDRCLVRRAGMVAIENTMHKGAVDGPAVLRLKLWQFLSPLGQGRTALSGPHEGVEREARDPFRMSRGEERSFQRPRRDTVDEKLCYAGRTRDVFGARGEVVGAVGDVTVNRALLIRASVALVVHAPGVKAARRKPIHH